MKSGGFLAQFSCAAVWLFRTLFPPACPLCSTTLPHGDHQLFCSACQNDLTPLPPAHCPLCAMPFSGHDNSSHFCGRCIKKRPVYTKVFAVGIYEKSLRHAVHQFKFGQRVGLDRSLAQLLDGCIERNLKIDLVVPVPLSQKKLQRRGYNQSLLLARELARIRALPVAENLLHKIRETKEQHGLSARERETNLQDAFALSTPLCGETVVLIDDVMTTGKTAETCAQVLIREGAGTVYVAVIGRAP